MSIITKVYKYSITVGLIWAGLFLFFNFLLDFNNLKNIYNPVLILIFSEIISLTPALIIVILIRKYYDF